MGKRRLDALLVDRGLAESQEKARALVMAGQVTRRPAPAGPPRRASSFPSDVALAVDTGAALRQPRRRQARACARSLRLDPTGLVAADIGSSTGGFTDCLLQHGARSVYAIDVGQSQLDYRLRNDPRVVSMEGVNARDLDSLPSRRTC